MTVSGQEPEPDEPSAKGSPWPFDLMLICLLAVVMATLIGVGAGVVWLRVFAPA